MIWAVDRISGDPLTNVGYAVSESFVVATKRVKHALKNDIPSIYDDISKLLHVGRATIDKLKDIRKAAEEEKKEKSHRWEMGVPDALNQICKVRRGSNTVEVAGGGWRRLHTAEIVLGWMVAACYCCCCCSISGKADQGFGRDDCVMMYGVFASYG
jgi:hypothetical protein